MALGTAANPAGFQKMQLDSARGRASSTASRRAPSLAPKDYYDDDGFPVLPGVATPIACKVLDEIDNLYSKRGLGWGWSAMFFFVSIDGEGWRLEMLEGREGRGWKVEGSCVPIRLIRRVPRPRLLHRQPRQSRSSTRNRPGGREQL